jgi:hypothetical protein
MLKRFGLALQLVFFTTTAPAFACGAGTVALIESVMAMDKPPVSRCGSEFNEMLASAHKKDWKRALAAYEAHLAKVGKRRGVSANESETLDFLRRKADAQ